MKLYIKQKVFSWGAKFRIYDEYENDKYSLMAKSLLLVRSFIYMR